MKISSLHTSHRKGVLRRKALAIAISSATMGFSGALWAQAITGTIYGTVPVAPGETIQVTGGAGFNRTITVDASGKYSITLPVGTYTVSLLRDGKVVESRDGISPVAAGAVEVGFAAATSTSELSTIHVTGSTPVIDTTTTNQVTTITAKQLALLPLQRTAEDIAMLAPGVNMGSPELVSGPLGTPINVFGGASIAENAYYIDGMNTTEALNNQGGISLPYGAIEQQQTFISGYGAEYGRSIGGVINQIGKSGSDDWHFGARALWQPGSLRSDPVNYTFNNPLETNPGEQPGDLQHYRKSQTSSETIYDAYVSGPIIKDTLFFFAGIEADKQSGTNIGSITSPYATNIDTRDPKLYAKVNWNINDRNILTVTGLRNSSKTWGTNYNFDYDTKTTGDFASYNETTKTDFSVLVANFSSYLTDSLTFNAMLGKMHGEYFTEQPGYDPSLPHISSASYQDPAFIPPGSSGISNSQTNSSISDPQHREAVVNYRVSFDYKWNEHDFKLGLDNVNSSDSNDGSHNTGPGYEWIYGYTDPGSAVFGVDPTVPPYAGPSSQCGPDASGTVHCYYVQKHVDSSVATVRVAQRAAYLEDNWQITHNLLLNLGLRDDQFVNYDGSNVAYITETKPQWAPRLGFSWDVHGDASTKVFGNAGRYYLALPTQVALSIAAPVTNAGVYGTYTGIDPTTGAPIGFTPLSQNPASGVSIDSEYGQAKDPRVSASQNIKAEFSDNFVIGLQQQFDMLGEQWVFGATGTFQRMNRIIDDYDAIQNECAAGLSQGYAWMTPDTCSQWAQSLVLINPGVTNKLLMKAPDGSLVPVNFTKEDQGFTLGPKRRYVSVDLSLEHAWDGKWFGKLDYVWSKTWGNDEGPVSTYSQQSGSYESITTAWDFPERMEFSNGILPNSRKHQLKLYGGYQIIPDWTIGANAYVASGTPVLCRGYYGPNQVALHGSHTYFWCGGEPAPPGSRGFTPWTHDYDVSLDYRPAWADHKLDFNVAVFNVLNQQTPIFYNDSFGSTNSPNPNFGQIQDTRPPRSIRFSVAYDF